VTAPDPAVLEAAVEAALRQSDSPEGGYQVLRGYVSYAQIRDVITAAYPLIAAAVEARTADAIADRLEQTAAAMVYTTATAWRHGVLYAADRARAYRSAAPEGEK
jgi:hypothetical protein